MRLPIAAFAALIALCGLAAPAHAQDEAEIFFGDDTSDFANNGECDDPRFQGEEGMASIVTASDIARDATDCSAGVEAGKLTFPPLPEYTGEGSAPTIDEIEFGDDSSDYAGNGVCDDPRFGGRMMASVLISNDIRRDASDCKQGVEIGEVVFVNEEYSADEAYDDYAGDEFEGEEPSAPGTDGGRVDLSGIDFGDNESPFALNAQCDDRRFEGEGLATILIESDIGHDASDCALAVIDGRATYQRAFDQPSTPIGDIEFGDDSSSYANNAECDDPRFVGDGMAAMLLEGDIRHDATDCRTAVENGSITYVGEQE